MAVRLQPDAGAHRRKTEEVHISGGGQFPIAAGHFNPESGIELQHFQDLEATMQVEQKGTRLQGISRQHTRPRGGVDLQSTRGIDHKDCKIRIDTHIQAQGQARSTVRINRSATPRAQRKWPDIDCDIKLELEAVFTDVNIKRPRSLRKSKELNVTF